MFDEDRLNGVFTVPVANAHTDWTTNFFVDVPSSEKIEAGNSYPIN